MKIVAATPSQLTLRHRPVWLWLFGLAFVSAGLAAIVTFGKVVTLNCNRVAAVQSNCQLKSSGLLGMAEETALDNLQGARVDRSSSSDGDTFRVVLLTNQGEVPFTDYYSSGASGKHELATQISTFLDSSQTSSLTLQQDDRWFMFLFGGIFVVAGLAVAIGLGEIVICEFDRTLGSLTMKRHGLFGTKVIERRLQEIKDVQVEESRDSDGSTYRVSLVFNVGDRIPLTSYYSSGQREKQAIADQLRSFLQLNPNPFN